MPSSRSAPSSSRRFILLAVAIVLAIAAYTAGWNYIAGRLVTETDAVISRLNSGGNRAACDRAEARGYPFRIGLFCASVFVEQRAQGFSLSAKALRSAAQIYDPFRVVAELDGPAYLTVPGIAPLELSWRSLRSSARLDRPLPDRVSLEATDFSASAEMADGMRLPAASAARLELHARPAGNDVELGARFEDLALGLALAAGPVPAVSGVADVVWQNGAPLLGQGTVILRGSSFTVRRVDFSGANGAMLSVAGVLSVGDDGLVNADLQLSTTDAAALAEFLGAVFPHMRQQMQSAATGLAALGERPALPLKIVDGQASLGFLPLGTVPPL